MTQEAHTTSTGHDLSTANWLDVHFEVCRPDYAALVALVGFEPGWHVLDAGCGSGSYLQLLAEQVGPGGKLTALDLAPGNIEMVRARAASERLKTPVEAVEDSILELPFADDTFDAAWCANVVLYLSDDDLRRALAEFRRVVRPGGLVAIKDFSLDISTIRPMPYGYFEHLIALQLEHTGGFWYGGLRSWNLRGFLTGAELEDVWQRSLLSEHRQPLGPMNQQLQGGFMQHMATGALEVDIPDGEREFWQRQLDPESPDAIVNHPDYYNAEAQVLAVGRVPNAS